MARGRESKYIKKITGREEKLFKQLARTGLTDRTQAKIFCNINPDRLKKLENSKYITRSNHCVEGQNTEIIRLGSMGKSYCKNDLNIDSFAYAQSNHLTHDLKLSLSYYSLPAEVQETWEHERDILKDIYNRHPEMEGKLNTCIDARVTVNGIATAIEVVGSSYGKLELDMKEEIALGIANCNGIEFIK